MAANVQDALAFKLMVSILDLVKSSGVTNEEASAAIEGARAMLGELALDTRPTLEIHSR